VRLLGLQTVYYYIYTRSVGALLWMYNTIIIGLKGMHIQYHYNIIVFFLFFQWPDKLKYVEVTVVVNAMLSPNPQRQCIIRGYN
jgi:hypothetical protein